MGALRVLLVIDDTPDVRRMVRVLLERAGAVVAGEASSIPEALGLLRGSDEGVIVVDHHLDGEISGFDGAAMLKERAPKAVVVLFSAFDLEKEAEANPAIDAFLRKDQIVQLPRVVRQVDRSPAREPSGERSTISYPSISARDLLLARWLSSPSLLFGKLPPPLESAVVLDELIEPTPARSDSLLRFVGASGDVDVAVAHLLVLRRVIETQQDPTVDIDLGVLDLLIVEVTSNVISAARRAAMVDPLTGMGNRRALEAELRSSLARCERMRRPLTLLYFDLVGLKRINDRLGHDAGDRALISFARAVELEKRTGDGCYRIGGDEFVLVLPDTTATDAETFVDRLKRSESAAFSVGMADTDHDGYDASRLVRIADVRMLQTRYQRGNFVERGDELSSQH
jgi:diguanylate cyclase (GGDEF)-like protein